MSTETPGIDPLLALRAPRDPACDVFLTGTVFLDIVFTGLDSAPVRGTESWARGMGSSPGGVANMATALARLGLRTSLAAAFGDDHYGEYCWDALEQGEGIDLSMSHTVPGWHSPVTVSMAYEGERTMVSHGHEAPAPTGAAGSERGAAPASEPAAPEPPASEPAAPGPAFPRCPPRARAAIASLAPGRAEPWVATAARDGALIFADVGWDETGRWDLDALPDLAHCEAFLPNAEEAMRYTRTDCPRAAAHALAERVPLAVVTLGAEGAYAVDGRTGAAAAVPAIEVEALDPTGAGDVFVAGFVTGTLADWPLADRLAFAGLTAALSVQEFGGSLSAPGWAEVAAWWQRIRTCAGQDPAALERYAFLDDLLPTTARAWPLRRAVPTIGFRQ
ncbi:PfkB family carbohydrate kinase [Streptomyces sp. ATCC51928]|uniref:Carbohydrate kinase family protein n=1 Tax=Streptomyces caviscabies TaxID=90079 RepID=A0ABW2M4G2_9ACTN|nr:MULTISPECIES: PfkB family carbohydrate kinase [Streptomyces]MCX4708709.1 PfkB family carbohydrate kinase [Streptomyces griseus]MDX3507059.1 PfkB family carbohydrate kinase [Streptomyces sp. ATCC51928]MDX5523609.1 PfkB family carbohydrate kinase [Streptomyces sp. DE06-01C]QXQ96767.1 sugar kinase [Streptomyces sp. WY228]